MALPRWERRPGAIGLPFVGAAHRGRPREGAVALLYANRGEGAAPTRMVAPIAESG